MILNSRQPLKLIPRADFKPEEFRKVIFSHGMDLSWEQVAECPCSRETGDYGFNATLTNTEHSNQSRSDCPACKGKGYIYHSKQDIKSVITGLKKTDDRHSSIGGSEFSHGEIGITLLPEHLPSLGDRFTVKTSAILYRETIIYESGVKTRYPIIQRSHDLLTGSLSFGVRYMIKSNTDGIVNPADILEEGTDFTVSSSGAFTWINEPTQEKD